MISDNDDYESFPVIRVTTSDMSEKQISKMDIRDHGKLIFSRAKSEPEKYIDLFENCIGKILYRIDDHMSIKKESEQTIPKEQMEKYEIEFYTWFSYMNDLINKCNDTEYYNNISYLAYLHIVTKWNYAKENLTEILIARYEDNTRHKYVTDFFESEYEGQYEHQDIQYYSEKIKLYIKILKMTKSNYQRIYKKHWMDFGHTCIKYLQYQLQKGNKLAAKRIASIGLELFSDDGDFAAVALDIFDPKEVRMIKAYCTMYAISLDSQYYQMAKASPHWNAQWARRLAEMLAVLEEYKAEILVLVEANMHKEAFDVLQYDGSIKIAIAHNKILVAANADKYYEICREFVISAPKKKKNKVHYIMIQQCLRIIKSIPGHESDFDELYNSILQQQNAGFASPVLCKLIKEIR